MTLTKRLLDQQRHDKKKLYAMHAPEVECIAKGKAHKRYEFGVKVSIATTNRSNSITWSPERPVGQLLLDGVACWRRGNYRR